jgi:hypothetical protein
MYLPGTCTARLQSHSMETAGLAAIAPRASYSSGDYVGDCGVSRSRSLLTESAAPRYFARPIETRTIVVNDPRITPEPAASGRTTGFTCGTTAAATIRMTRSATGINEPRTACQPPAA